MPAAISFAPLESCCTGRVNHRLNSMANSRSSTSKISATGHRMLRSTSAAVAICAMPVDTMMPYLPSAESWPTSICRVEPICTILYSEPSSNNSCLKVMSWRVLRLYPNSPLNEPLLSCSRQGNMLS